METVLPLLKQFGISPEQLGPERIKNLENLVNTKKYRVRFRRGNSSGI